MAYRRYQSRRRVRPRRYKRKTYKPKSKSSNVGKYLGYGLTGVSLAKKVYDLYKLINVEKKYVIHNTSFSADASYNGNIMLCAGPAQGTAYNERTGNSIKISSMQFALQVNPQANATNQSISYKVYFLHWNGDFPAPSYTTGVNGTLTSLFLDPDQYGGLTTHSLRETSHFGNWRILKVLSGGFKAEESSTSGAPQRNHKGYFKPNIHCRLEPSSTVFANNPIYILALTSVGMTPTAATGLDFKLLTKCYYIDN